MSSHSTDANGVRWGIKPSYSLRAAAQCRELAEVRAPIAPWGNAFRLALDHEIEVAALERQADLKAWSHPCLAV